MAKEKPTHVSLTDAEKEESGAETGYIRSSILTFIENNEACARDDKRASNTKQMLKYQGRANAWKYVLALLDTKSITTEELKAHGGD